MGVSVHGTDEDVHELAGEVVERDNSESSAHILQLSCDGSLSLVFPEVDPLDLNSLIKRRSAEPAISSYPVIGCRSPRCPYLEFEYVSREVLAGNDAAYHVHTLHVNILLVEPLIHI